MANGGIVTSSSGAKSKWGTDMNEGDLVKHCRYDNYGIVVQSYGDFHIDVEVLWNNGSQSWVLKRYLEVIDGSG